MTGHHKPFYKHMYVQVLIAIAIGTLLGLVAPALAVQMQPLGDAFIKAIRMLIGPIVFAIVRLIMYAAPIGAFGSIAFTIGTYGVGTLVSLSKLIAGVWITSGVFVVVVLGAICWVSGFSLWKFLRYIKEEIFLIFGTTSAEIALPRIMAKLENLGCARTVVGLTIPTGYSFNLDGSAVYLSMAAIFIAQA